MSAPTASAPTASIPATPTLQLTKLQTQDLPRLKGLSPKPLDIALWLRALVRWSQLSGYNGYLEAPHPATSDPTLNRDALRYLSASIESPSLAGSLADQKFTSSARAFEYVKTKWLHGESESTILKRQLTNSVFNESLGIQSYLADWNLYLSHIKPALTSEEAADLLDSSLPDRFEPFITAARNSPGLTSHSYPSSSGGGINHKASFQAYTDELASLSAKSDARRTARMIKHGAVPSAFDSLTSHAAPSHPVLDTPLASSLLDRTPETDLEHKIQKIALEFEALATQARNSMNPSRSGNSHRNAADRSMSSSLPGNNAMSELRCFACGELGHVVQSCPKEPKPVCTHGLCKLRGRVTHLPEYCPFGNSSCIRNPRLRLRCEHEASIWEAATKAALALNQTPALHTGDTRTDDEAQLHFLEDLNDETTWPDYDALTCTVCDDAADLNDSPLSIPWARGDSEGAARYLHDVLIPSGEYPSDAGLLTALYNDLPTDSYHALSTFVKEVRSPVVDGMTEASLMCTEPSGSSLKLPGINLPFPVSTDVASRFLAWMVIYNHPPIPSLYTFSLCSWSDAA